jgi:chorismate mutase-like protein
MGVVLMRSFSLFLAVGLALTGCRSQDQAPVDPALDHLLSKMNERLILMEAVAKTKYRRGLPASDAAREETMLRALEAKAKEVSLKPTTVRWFFAAQIEAAKLVQENHFRRWKAEGGPDVGHEEDIFQLRKQIDQLNDELIAGLIEFRKHLTTRKRIEDRARELIKGEGIDDAVRSTAIRPLLEGD